MPWTASDRRRTSSVTDWLEVLVWAMLGVGFVGLLIMQALWIWAVLRFLVHLIMDRLPVKQ